MPKPLLVFDLDGTLADTAGDLMVALNHVLAGENVARPRTTLACASVRESDSGSGAIASIRRLSVSASRPAERARATLGAQKWQIE